MTAPEVTGNPEGVSFGGLLLAGFVGKVCGAGGWMGCCGNFGNCG